MGKIKQLPLHEAQKIAAGEVVERPANVVKELIENSIDAGAQHLHIYLEHGGHTLIRVIDDGSGMSPDDAQACFGHHATSKISSVNDLTTLASFGFRGEALASISAVSVVELVTKEQHATQGTKIRRENNINIIDDISCAHGTDISVHALFYNVPARKKFLKTEQAELRAIILFLQACCVDYPHLHVVLYSDKKELYNYPPVNAISDRAYQLWGTQAQYLIPIKTSVDHGTITGLISNHQWYRYDRNQLFFFVNRRWIKNQQLAKSLLKGYLNVIPQGRFPSALINIDIDPAYLDINIHPRKQDVEFLQPRNIEQALEKAVKEALESNLSSTLKKSVTLSSAQTYSYREPLSTRTIAHQQELAHKLPHEFMQSIVHHEEKNERIIEEKLLEDLHILGQYKNTYLLIEHEKGLLIIDQHAAHERIVYEQFHTRFDTIASVNLVFPHIIKFSVSDYEIISPYLDLVNHHGIKAEPFGNNQLIIQSIPVHLKHASMDDLLHELIGLIQEYRSLAHDEFLSIMHEKIHAQMACKAAVKAGDILTQEQMHRIIIDLNQTENRFVCPHGRPTSWLLGIYELEKKFKRV